WRFVSSKVGLSAKPKGLLGMVRIMHNPDASRVTSADLRPGAPTIEHDSWMVAKSVVFCGAATAIVTAIGLMAEAYLL
ncbi:hypothetical protein, partial [Mycobacteroides abscessus]